MQGEYDRILLHRQPGRRIVFLRFGEAHVPPDRHDFLHREPDIALDQHDGLLSVAERELVVDLVGLYRLPDVITHLVMLALPRLSRGDLFRIIYVFWFFVPSA